MDILTRTSDLATRDYGLGGNGAHIVIPSIAGPLLAAALVYNRLYWRIHLVRTLGIDDLCIGLSLIFLFALAIVNLVAVNHGYGRPSNSLRPADLQLALQMFYLDQIFYKFTINLTKLSILTLYLRIFTQPWFVRTCWCCFALVSAYATASILATVFQCTPINHYWERPRTASSSSTCISTPAFWLANAIYNLGSDIIILTTLPFMIWSLRLPRAHKVGLTVVFGLGVFVFATSVLRLTTLPRGSRAQDPLTGTVRSTMWTMIEASAAVVCACLPMCRTPLQRLWPRLFSSRYSSAGGLQTRTQSQTGTSGASRGAGPDRPTPLFTHHATNRSGSVILNGNRHGTANGAKMVFSHSVAGRASDGPRQMSGATLPGHRGPGGRTLEDDDDDEEDCFEDLEMQHTATARGGKETDRQGIIGGVVPVRMKGW